MKDILPIIWIFTITVLNSVASENTVTYKFGDDCSVSIEHVNEEKTVIAEYYGEQALSSWCDQMSFIGRDDGYLNEYEICVTPEVYEDPNCAMELRYKDDYSGYPLKSYDCYDKPVSRYCGKQDEYFYIELKSLKSSSSARSGIQIKLKVEAVMTYDYYKMVGIIVGSVIGGLVVLSLLCGIVICFTCRQKRSSGQVIRGSATPLAQTNVQTNYPQPPGGYQPTGAYPTQSSGGYPTQPAGGFQSNYSTNYSSPTTGGNDTTPSAPSGFTYNSPPPAYADVTK